MFCNGTSELWGELAPPQEAEWDKIVPKDLGKLVILSAIKTEQPKPYHPAPDESCNKVVPVPKEWITMDPVVLDTIKLLDHCRKVQDLMDIAASEEKEEENVMERVKNCPPFPDITEKKVKEEPDEDKKKFHVLQQNELSAFATGRPVEQPKICTEASKELLKKSVAALLAHAGFNNSMESALTVLADVAEEFLQKFTAHLRDYVDDEILYGPTMFPDVVEQVYYKMGLGSVESLEEYYQNRVLSYRDKVHNECLKLVGEHQVRCALLQVAEPSFHNRFKEEEGGDIPEIHFLGDGDESGLDDLQPSLHTEYQMLGKLEEEVQRLE